MLIFGDGSRFTKAEFLKGLPTFRVDHPVVLKMMGRDPEARAQHLALYDWIPAGAFSVDAGFFVDPLTACLLIVVTTIGMLVHVLLAS